MTKKEETAHINYTTERFSAEIDAKTYIEGFRKVGDFVKFCQQCRNYGRRYSCPPFEDGALSIVNNYQKVRIYGVKILPQDKNLPLEAANQLMEPVTNQLNRELLEEEKALYRFGLGFVG